MIAKFKEFKAKIDNKQLRKHSRKVFWLWIGYQTVKGTITTTFFWIPMIYSWLHHG